jgi:RNA polymerase sigma factor (sigma-70 family)
MHIRAGEFDKAGGFLEKALEYHLAPPHHRPDMLSMILMLVAELAGHKDKAEDGARLLGASLAILDVIGLKITEKSHLDVDRTDALLRSLLDGDVYEQALREGHQMSIPAAIDLAIRITAAPVAEEVREVAAQPDDDLTPREREVLRLLAAGKSNAEIADELFISQRTVTTHLTRLYAKLEVTSRTAAISAALRLGLVGPT